MTTELEQLKTAVRRYLSVSQDASTLLPDQDNWEWPPGYDFDELEGAQLAESEALTELRALLGDEE